MTPYFALTQTDSPNGGRRQRQSFLDRDDYSLTILSSSHSTSYSCTALPKNPINNLMRMGWTMHIE